MTDQAVSVPPDGALAIEPLGPPPPAVWPKLEDTPVVEYGNIVNLQTVFDGVILTVGQASPPLLIGDIPAQKAQLEAMESVPIRVLGRYFVSVGQATVLVDQLEHAIGQHELLMATIQATTGPPGS
jgi:hypothetical protein